MNKDELTKAYQMVYSDLIKNPMYKGNYDAKNGNVHFMYGINNVMSVIALKASPEIYEQFSQIFVENLVKSKKVLTKKINNSIMKI